MRVISGELGSRRIPFNNKKFGHARVTSDIVKEAVFGSIGPDLTGLRFLDLFSGSGQMGIEAISRGGTAWLNDKDRKRVAFVESLGREWGISDSLTTTGIDARKLLGQFSSSGETFDLVYIDPPYDASSKDGLPLASLCLTGTVDAGIMNQGARIFVQHDRRTELPNQAGSLVRTKQKRYGDSILSTYRLND